MTKIYIIAGIAGMIFAAYWAGGQIATQRCRADVAVQQNMSATQLQTEIIETKTKINEETFNTSSADIRGLLRSKYTIAE